MNTKSMFFVGLALAMTMFSIGCGESASEEFEVSEVKQAATTRDVTCKGPNTTAAANGCKEVCIFHGGTYDPDMGHIGGCRGLPNGVNPGVFDFNRKSANPDL